MVRAGVVELEVGETLGSDSVGLRAFVWLVDEIPDFQVSVWEADHDDPRPGGAEGSAGDLRALDDIAFENGDHLDLVLPNAEVEVVQRQDNVLENGGNVQSHRRPVTPFLLPEFPHHLLRRVHGGHHVHQVQFAFVRGPCKRKLLLFLSERDLRTAHLSAALRSEQLHAVQGLPNYILELQ